MVTFVSILAFLAMLDYAALKWGVDSRDGLDWQPQH